MDVLIKEDFGFLEFSNIQEASNALNKMHGAVLGNSRITVEEAKAKDN